MNETRVPGWQAVSESQKSGILLLDTHMCDECRSESWSCGTLTLRRVKSLKMWKSHSFPGICWLSAIFRPKTAPVETAQAISSWTRALVCAWYSPQLCTPPSSRHKLSQARTEINQLILICYPPNAATRSIWLLWQFLFHEFMWLTCVWNSVFVGLPPKVISTLESYLTWFQIKAPTFFVKVTLFNVKPHCENMF